MTAEPAVAARIENGHCPCCGCDYCPNDCRDLCCKAASGLEEGSAGSEPRISNRALATAMVSLVGGSAVIAAYIVAGPVGVLLVAGGVITGIWAVELWRPR